MTSKSKNSAKAWVRIKKVLERGENSTCKSLFYRKYQKNKINIRQVKLEEITVDPGLAKALGVRQRIQVALEKGQDCVTIVSDDQDCKELMTLKLMLSKIVKS